MLNIPKSHVSIHRLIHKIYMWQFMTSVIPGNPSFRWFFSSSNAGQSLAEAIGQFEWCEAPRVLVKLSVLELLHEDFGDIQSKSLCHIFALLDKIGEFFFPCQFRSEKKNQTLKPGQIRRSVRNLFSR